MRDTILEPAVDVMIAARQAARAIPPAFPLDATVAVNPFLGQSGLDLAQAAAVLGETAGARLTRPRRDYGAMIAAGQINSGDLAAALAGALWANKPADVAALMARIGDDSPAPQALPTLAQLAMGADGTDWPAVITRSFGLWAAGYFDRGQAFWTPRPGLGAYSAWREWARHDLTPEIAGLTGFCAFVEDAPDTADRAIARSAARLMIPNGGAEAVFSRLLMDLGGWAQHARWIMWQAELAGATDSIVTDLLAIRLIWEEALLAQFPQLMDAWQVAALQHSAPITPTSEQVLDAILQEAAEHAHQRGLMDLLTGTHPASGRAAMQAAFCIDVRSEVFRRALEAQNDQIETIGFAGFFGLPIAHAAQGSDDVQAHLPVLLAPALRANSHQANEQAARISARAGRAWGRFRQAAVSSFAFVEAAGPIYGWKLARDSFGQRSNRAMPAPKFDPALDSVQKTDIAAAILKAMGLTQGFAPLVLLIGHGSETANDPHESAYHCGACGGQTGAVSARLLADMLNCVDTRAGLASMGIDVPADTVFVGGLHNTVTDEVTLWGADGAQMAQADAWLAGAGRLTRAERAARLPGARTMAQRAADWAEVRPEWGLAGCAAFIAAPRDATKGRDLQGRAFLHSYDWRGDADFATLEMILTAPVVVASWISLQYYGASLSPDVFGGGDKVIHNVVGGIGVVEGNGGMLRAGLPWQAVHDGTSLVHEPLRLSVMLEAPTAAITAVLEKHPQVRALFDNGWLHLIALSNGRAVARYRPGLIWQDFGAQG